MTPTIAELQEKLTAKDAEIAQLRNALRPFARLADSWPTDNWNDDDIVYGYGSNVPTVGDLRRARAVLDLLEGNTASG